MTSLVTVCLTSYQSDICRFRAMTLSPSRLIVNWPVLPFINSRPETDIRLDVNSRAPAFTKHWRKRKRQTLAFVLKQLNVRVGKNQKRCWRTTTFVLTTERLSLRWIQTMTIFYSTPKAPSTPATMSKQQATLSKLRSSFSKQHLTLLLQTATMSKIVNL